MELTYKGKRDTKKYNYYLKDELTGADFLDIRRRASSGGGGMLSFVDYNHANLVTRLERWTRPEAISNESVLALGSDIYHLLNTACIRLEADELRDANSFLAETIAPSLQQELSSILEASEEAPVDTFEPPSPEEK